MLSSEDKLAVFINFSTPYFLSRKNMQSPVMSVVEQNFMLKWSKARCVIAFVLFAIYFSLMSSFGIHYDFILMMLCLNLEQVLRTSITSDLRQSIFRLKKWFKNSCLPRWRHCYLPFDRNSKKS